MKPTSLLLLSESQARLCVRLSCVVVTELQTQSTLRISEVNHQKKNVKCGIILPSYRKNEETEPIYFINWLSYDLFQDVWRILTDFNDDLGDCAFKMPPIMEFPQNVGVNDLDKVDVEADDILHLKVSTST